MEPRHIATCRSDGTEIIGKGLYRLPRIGGNEKGSVIIGQFVSLMAIC